MRTGRLAGRPTTQYTAGRMTAPTAPTLDLDGHALPVRIRRSARAGRLSLRLAADGDGVVLVLPAGIAVAEGLRFARSRHDWLRRRLAALPPRVPFADGAVVPVLGVGHRLRHRPEARRGVWLEGDEIHVSGGSEHLARRVADFLRARALREASTRAHAAARRLQRVPRRIAVRDTTSRWASCTAAGDLAFSWRLVLAPEPVFDYVVAHEVAHLAEMNHGPAFWRLVASLVADVAAPRDWLRRHGPALHRYG